MKYMELRKLPAMYFDSLAQIMALPEYSCTVPTGVRIGKKWRRHDGSFDRDFMARGGKPVWLIGSYEEAPSEWRTTHQIDPETNQYKRKLTEMCKTCWYRPVVRVKARQEIV